MSDSSINSSRLTLALVVALGIAWPFVVDGALVELFFHLTPRIANAVFHSGIRFEHSSFVGAMRAIDGVILVVLIGVIFGIPLGALVSRHPSLYSVVFVATTLLASLSWHLSYGYGSATFFAEWRSPELWFALVAVLGIATFILRLKNRQTKKGRL